MKKLLVLTAFLVGQNSAFAQEQTPGPKQNTYVCEGVLSVSYNTPKLMDVVFFKDSDPKSFRRLLNESEQDLEIKEVDVLFRIAKNSCLLKPFHQFPICVKDENTIGTVDITFSYIDESGDIVTKAKAIPGVKIFNLNLETEQVETGFLIEHFIRIKLEATIEKNDKLIEYNVAARVGQSYPLEQCKLTN